MRNKNKMLEKIKRHEEEIKLQPGGADDIIGECRKQKQMKVGQQRAQGRRSPRWFNLGWSGSSEPNRFRGEYK